MELKITITDEQFHALSDFIQLRQYAGRWQTVTDWFQENIQRLICAAMNACPPPAIQQKKEQLQQLQGEINAAATVHVELVSGEDSVNGTGEAGA